MRYLAFLAWLLISPLAGAAQAPPAEVPSGGLCIHLGCGDGSCTAELAAQTGAIVHGLDGDAIAIAAGRKTLLSRGVYGQVTLQAWDLPSLPYADNVVNTVVVEKPGKVTRDEILRVLCPGGVAFFREGDGWNKQIKPRPAEMDEWTHWRHGPDRNPVSRDRLVEVPQRIQWLSVHGRDGREGKDMVTAGGRNFYQVGDTIVARDAFNGLQLWSVRAIGKCTPVAVGQNVFVLRSGKLTCLDAATGSAKRVYDDGSVPTTILNIADARDPEGVLVAVDGQSVRALAVTSGKLLWKREAALPRAVVAGGQSVFFVAGDPKADQPSVIVALDLSTGAPRWETAQFPWAKICYRACYGNGMLAFETGKYAVPRLTPIDKTTRNCIHFVSAKDGQLIKDYEYQPAMRHDENPRAFFVGDKVAMHRMERDRKASSLVLFKDVRGEPETFPALPPSSHYFYCYPPVATERFFIYGQMSFTDWATREHTANQITRGTCGSWTEGIIPANGLVYVFPKSCNCFSMLHGFGALAPAYRQPIAESTELVKGPAYGAPAAGKARPGDWPCLRGDEYRSGYNPATVPDKLRNLWSADIALPAYKGPSADEWKDYPFSAGPITPPVVAEGRVLLAQPHTHRVIALDAADGKPQWEFMADGRVDSPPTIHEGMVLFGCRSGWVYCLRTSDGALIWKLRAAPAEMRIVQCGQLESPWPAQGSVLVADGLAYFAVGIHPLADGGIRAFAVNPRTGEIQWKKTLTDMGYDKNGWHARAGLEQDYFDLMVKDGRKIAMSRWQFDPLTGEHEFLWHNAYYRIGDDGAYMQRGTWSYGYPMNRPRMRRPLLVAHGPAIVGANKVREGLKLFRRDFKLGEKFDTSWDEQPNDTASRIGVYFPVNRIAENTTWTSAYPGWIEAMVWAGDNVLLYAQGKLRCYSAADANPLFEMEHPRPVWDGLAAAHGRLYISTQDGKVLCLGQ